MPIVNPGCVLESPLTDPRYLGLVEFRGVRAMALERIFLDGVVPRFRTRPGLQPVPTSTLSPMSLARDPSKVVAGPRAREHLGHTLRGDTAS